MKNKAFFKYVTGLLLVIAFITACQDIDEPALGDFPLDGPVITLISPSPNGTTVLQTLEEVASITIQFSLEDDIELSSVRVQINDNEIYNQAISGTSFTVEDLVFDNVTTGDHTLTITATDSDGIENTVTVPFSKIEAVPFTPVFGEVFYMPFEDNFFDVISLVSASEVGSPGFAGEGSSGTDNSFVAGTDNYLTFPADGLLTQEFSAAFWYKVNSTPDRAGILVVGDDADDRFQGFRLFREGSSTEQRIKLNVGTGSGESWNDGGVINVADQEWVHVAFSISTTETKVYLNGEEVNTGAMAAPVDWTGCTEFVIGSGGPTFDYWNHLSDSSQLDELRFFDTAITLQQVQEMAGVEPYIPLDGETFYMSFEGDYTEINSGSSATVVGSPTTTSGGVSGQAYQGAEDAYLTFPTDGLLGEEFSAAFWMNINATPDRAGILVIGPPDESNPDSQNNRVSGFRFFRENAGGMQRFKLNVGDGTGDWWFDGGTDADVEPDTDQWVHFAFTISGTEGVVYINGEIVSQRDDFPGVDWTGCDILSIMSGAPRFTGWGHRSDSSLMDELRLFDKALTQEEVQAMLE